ncbi:MAG: hypothetical protein ACKPA7_19380, partial [Sphaerospermopsis kisseleviana]
MIDISNDDDAARASLLPPLGSSLPVAADEGEKKPATKSILFFWADWHEPSSPGGAFDVLLILKFYFRFYPKL